MRTAKPQCDAAGDSGTKAPGGRVLRVLLALGVLLAASLTAAAPPTATSPTSIPATPTDVDLSAEALQSQIRAVQAATDLSQEVKDKVLESYNQAVNQIRLAENWAVRAKALEATEQQLAEVKARRAALTTMPAATAPAEIRLDKLKEALGAAKASLKEAEKGAQDLDTQIRSRTARRAELPKLISEARKQIDLLNETLAQPPSGGVAPQVAKAENLLTRARKKTLEQEIATEEKELLRYESLGELLTAQKDLVASQRDWLEKQVKVLEEATNKASREEAAELERQARETARSLANAHPLVREMAEGDLRLAERLNGPSGLLAKIREVSAQSQAVSKQIIEIRKDADVTRDRVERTGLTHAIGALLLKKRNELLQVQRSLGTGAFAESQIGAAQFQKDELQDQRSSLGNVDRDVQQTLQRVQTPLSEMERENLEWAIRKQVESRLKYLDELIAQYDAYFNLLVELDTGQKQLRDVVDSYKAYLDERILWLRNSPPLGWGALDETRDAVTGLLQPAAWRGVGVLLWGDAQGAAFLPVLAGCLLVGGLVLRGRLKAKVRQWGEQAGKAHCVSLVPTFRTMAVSLLLACLTPALVALPGWRLAVSAGDHAFAAAVASALLSAAGVLLILQVAVYACLPGGLGQMHFRWKPQSVKLLHRQLRWFTWAAAPLAFLVALTEAYGQDAWRNSLGRLALMLGLVLLSLFVQRVVRPRSGVWMRQASGKPTVLMGRLRVVWYPLAILVPLALAAITALGYSYTALRLTGRFIDTMVLGLGLAWAHGLIVRWLFLARRRLALQRARQAAEAREALARQPDAAPAQPPGGPMPPDPKMSLIAISDQTLQLLRLTIGLTFAVSAWLIWYDVLPALRAFHRVHLWSDTVTLADMGLAVLVLLITIGAAKNIPGLLGMTLLHRLELKDDVRFAITTLCRYLLMIVGIVVAFGMIGVDWSKVQWLVAAMTVGLGFGLQEIFANFVSGIILLFERPIRVGDTVTVGQTSGTVTRIRMRATTITDWDRKELIVPNKEFITGQLINWTLSDRVIRILIPVGIAYGSDASLARTLLLKAAENHPNVLKDPAPSAFFMGFGESALNLDLRVFIGDLSQGLITRHELNVAIDRAFREAGIEIAFPQMDLHVRTMENAVRGIAPGPHENAESAR